MDLKKFVLEGNPVCRKEAVIVGDHFRITMLTTALIRFEYSEDGGFEDRATQMVCNRDFPVPEFRVSDGGEELHIYTKDLEIHYDRQKFSPSGLMIRVAGGKASERVWHYGDEPKDLLGTARTLDEADGEIPLSHGIMSRNGFSVLDDSHTMAMGEDGMVEPRQGNRADFYFFGYWSQICGMSAGFLQIMWKNTSASKNIRSETGGADITNIQRQNTKTGRAF